jgi:hypothetical protein
MLWIALDFVLRQILAENEEIRSPFPLGEQKKKRSKTEKLVKF